MTSVFGLRYDIYLSKESCLLHSMKNILIFEGGGHQKRVEVRMKFKPQKRNTSYEPKAEQCEPSIHTIPGGCYMRKMDRVIHHV